MALAYGRRYQLTLAKPNAASFFDLLPNAIVISGLEIQFKVERTLEPTPNSAEIKVFNLSDAHRAEFGKKPLHIRLDVGYANDSQLAKLIEGDMIIAAPVRDGKGNVITGFTVGDGERAYNDASVSASFASGIDLKTAVSTVASSMGLTMPKNAQQAGEMLKQYSGGLTLHGPSSQVLSKLVKGSSFGWSIQDGQLQMLRDADTRAGNVELITPLNGLIESPDFGSPKQPGQPPILKFKLLLRPQLIPGGRVKIQSRDVDALFRISKVTHTGDFRDNDWYSELEVTAL